MPMSDPMLDEWIELSRTITADDRERQFPPADLWDRIAAEVEFDQAAATPTEDVAAPVIDLHQARTRRAPRTVRRHRRRLAVVAVAAAIVAIVGLSVLPTDDDATTFVAEATNAELPEPFDGSATATVSGSTLEISFSAALPDDEPLELWLIKPDLSDMVSLGLIDDQGDYRIPGGIDPAEFSLVDVSVEPNDGDPTHSGRSILRGELVST